MSTIEPHKKQFQTADMKVPVIFHTPEDLFPKENTFNELQEIAKNDKLFDHIAVLSDVHSKKGVRTPAGTIAASENHFIPQLLDAAPNCGMRLMLTDLNQNEVTGEKVDALYRLLQKNVPAKKIIGSKISHNVILDVFRKGSGAIASSVSARIKNEIENTFKNGNMFSEGINEEGPSVRDIRNVIPPFFRRIARYRLGILGATSSHFITFLRVKDIFNDQLASKLNIRSNQYVFLMHTGSGIIGRYIASLYTPLEEIKLLNKAILNFGQIIIDSQMKRVFRCLRRRIKEQKKNRAFIDYENQSIEGRMFHTAYQAACNYGFANRTLISDSLDRSLEKIFGRQINLELLYDMPHVHLNLEKYCGKDVWVHRNDAARAFGPSMIKDHSIFKETGEPVLVSPLENSLAYLGTGTDENETTFFSANHKIGSLEDINLTTVALNENKDKNGSIIKEGSRKVAIYRGKKKEVSLNNFLHDQYSQKIIEGMEKNKIMRKVVSLEPIAKLTY